MPSTPSMPSKTKDRYCKYRANHVWRRDSMRFVVCLWKLLEAKMVRWCQRATYGKATFNFQDSLRPSSALTFAKSNPRSNSCNWDVWEHNPTRYTRVFHNVGRETNMWDLDCYNFVQHQYEWVLIHFFRASAFQRLRIQLISQFIQLKKKPLLKSNSLYKNNKRRWT